MDRGPDLGSRGRRFFSPTVFGRSTRQVADAQLTETIVAIHRMSTLLLWRPSGPCRTVTRVGGAVRAQAGRPTHACSGHRRDPGYTRMSENRDDGRVWFACLRLVAPRSPRRAEVVGQLEQLRRELSTRPLATVL